MRNFSLDEKAFIKFSKEKELLRAGRVEYRVRVYVPLIKNVISDRELMWTDESNGTKWTHNTTEGFMRDGRSRTIPYPWAYHVRSWNEIGPGTNKVYLYSSDSTFMWYDIRQEERPSYLEWKSGPECFIMTDKRFVMFKSNKTGLRITLRLIEDRIPNATGVDESYTIAYPTSDVIFGSKEGWLRNWSDITDSVLAYKQKSKAYLMYRWNIIHEGDKLPAISLPEPDPYIYS